MFEDGIVRSSGRRSKLEITCDILNVVSRGTQKPTRIMQLANVTWDDLIMYLEVLIRNQLLSREVDGKRVQYSLTASGRSLLELYLKLRKEAAPLSLETLTKERISKALTHVPAIGVQGEDRYSDLEKQVLAKGLKLLDPKVVGKSGAVHSLGVVAQGKDGSRHCYVILKEADESQVMKLFVTQLDTDLNIHAFYSGEISPKAAALARAYSLDLSPWQDAEARPSAKKPKRPDEFDVRKFKGKNVLLEVDPSISYEVIVKEFARRFRASRNDVLAFTWKGGPIYSALSTLTGVAIFSMTSQVTHPTPVGQGNEILVPQDDPAILLDLMAKALQSRSDQSPLLIFDSISDMTVSLGFERTFAFLKAQREMLAKERNLTSLFIVKQHAHDERATSHIKGLFSEHLFYGPAGLTVTRIS